MKNIVKILAVLFLLFLCSKSFAQEKMSSYFISADFIQIKETENLGLVFKGPKLDAGLKFEIPIDNNLFVYQNSIGIGLEFSRGMLGLHFNFKPAELFYGYNISHNKLKIFLGPSLKAEYNVQLYPYLKGGQPYWFTNYYLGAAAIIEFPFYEKIFRVHLSSSLVGFISRPESDRDPYWMNFYFWDIVSQVHQNITFASILEFNNTTVQLEYFPHAEKKSFSITYSFDYYGTYKQPTVTFINQSIKFQFSL